MAIDILWAISFCFSFIALIGLRYIARFHTRFYKIFGDILLVSLGAQIASIILLFVQG